MTENLCLNGRHDIRTPRPHSREGMRRLSGTAVVLDALEASNSVDETSIRVERYEHRAPLSRQYCEAQFYRG
jgi:hypothetical protein